MKKSLCFLLASCLGISASLAEVRKWTSADDPTKTFDGEFVEAKGDMVTIKRKSGKPQTFPAAKLSKEDQDYIAQQAASKAQEAATKAAADKVKESPMAKALEKKLQKLDGKKFVKFDLLAEKAPEYYLLYWGASW
ncbi:MAG: hypothetical protein KA004_08415 [Verrucomicrobiales bacterium]|nr:hypothetical protein [Verrucomicrobiales bacterium]